MYDDGRGDWKENKECAWNKVEEGNKGIQGPKDVQESQMEKDFYDLNGDFVEVMYTIFLYFVYQYDFFF